MAAAPPTGIRDRHRALPPVLRDRPSDRFASSCLRRNRRSFASIPPGICRPPGWKSIRATQSAGRDRVPKARRRPGGAFQCVIAGRIPANREVTSERVSQSDQNDAPYHVRPFETTRLLAASMPAPCSFAVVITDHRSSIGDLDTRWPYDMLSTATGLRFHKRWPVEGRGFESMASVPLNAGRGIARRRSGRARSHIALPSRPQNGIAADHLQSQHAEIRSAAHPAVGLFHAVIHRQGGFCRI